MKNSFNLTHSKLFLLVLILLITINIVGVFIDDALILKTIMPLFVPVFLIFFFVEYKSISIAFIPFLFFSFLGDISVMFFLGDILIEVSSVLYILSYLFLLVIVAPKFKFLEVNAMVGTYLLVVFSIAVYFLHITYNIINDVVINHDEVFLYGLKSFILIVLTFVSFGVYLNTQTKQSALFLTVVVFFGLSVMLNYVNLYYLNNWILELLYRCLYATALYLMFKYIMNDKEEEIKFPKPIELKEKAMRLIPFYFKQ